MYKQKNDFLDPALQSTMEKPCPVCGGNDFEWGRLGGQSYYIPGQSMWSRRGYQYIRMRRCAQCNNLMQFADPELTKQQNRIIVVIVAIAVVAVLFAALLPVILMSAR